ncbi:hypothetical protein V8E51_009725 [Hyaloscypha variabilis]
MGATHEHTPASGLRDEEIPPPTHPSRPHIASPPNHTNDTPSSREKQHAHRPSSSTQNSRSTTTSSFSLSAQKISPTCPSSSPPPLSFSPWDKKPSIIVCTLGLLFFDLALPCLIYYTLYAYTSLNIEINLGISCASLGLGEMLELPLRGYRLFKYPEIYAPLGQQRKWGFDFLFWWYLVATVIGIVPYVMSTSLDEPILWLFLFTPGFLAVFASATAAVSLVPFRLPFRVSSDGKGERCKPFTYYVIEDFVAVDADQRRGYREELRERWNASPVFRRLLWEVNLWWTVGGGVYTGGLAGITWGCDFNTAYGLSFGVLFIWIGVWAAVTWWWVRRKLRIEREWFSSRTVPIEGNLEKEADIV